MELTFDDAQVELRRTARNVLAKRWTSAEVRRFHAGDDADLDALWPDLAELGWLGLTLPEEHGGSGASVLDLTLLAEELGRALLPITFHSTVVAADLLARAASTAQQGAVLPRVAAGDLRLSLAVLGPDGTYDPARPPVVARRRDGGWRLSGVNMFVPDADTAGLLLVVAADEAGSGSALAFLVEPGAAGVSIGALATIGRERESKVVLDDVDATLVGDGDDVGAALAATLDVALAMRAADLVGVGELVLEKTVAYMKQRHAFGVPLGSFQSVQHRCADMAIELDCATLLTREAGWLLSEGRPARSDVAAAKAFTSEVVKRLTLHAHQLHGGAGFSTEDDLHLYSGRAKAGELAFGTPDDLYEVVACSLTRWK